MASPASVAPRAGVQLPADLELVIGRQRQQGRPADQPAVGEVLDRPAPGRRRHAGVLSHPLLQQQPHGGQILDPVHGRC